MDNAPVTFNSVQEHAASLVLQEHSELDQALILSRINELVRQTPKVASMNAQVIANAVLVAMAPDPALSNVQDIYFVPYGQTIKVSFSHNFLQKLAIKNGAVKVLRAGKFQNISK